jgi:hypothetical protein
MAHPNAFVRPHEGVASSQPGAARHCRRDLDLVFARGRPISRLPSAASVRFCACAAGTHRVAQRTPHAQAVPGVLPNVGALLFLYATDPGPDSWGPLVTQIAWLGTILVLALNLVRGFVKIVSNLRSSSRRPGVS